MSEAFKQITERNAERHKHDTYDSQDRCSHCGSWVNKGTPENGQVRYYCEGCERHIMDWIGKTQKVTSD